MSYETSISGIRAALIRLNVSATDVANAATDGYTDHRVVNRERAGGGVDAAVENTTDQVSLEREATEQIAAVNAAKANAAALRTTAEAERTVLDLFG